MANNDTETVVLRSRRKRKSAATGGAGGVEGEEAAKKTSAKQEKKKKTKKSQHGEAPKELGELGEATAPKKKKNTKKSQQGEVPKELGELGEATAPKKKKSTKKSQQGEALKELGELGEATAPKKKKRKEKKTKMKRTVGQAADEAPEPGMQQNAGEGKAQTSKGFSAKHTEALVCSLGALRATKAGGNQWVGNAGLEVRVTGGGSGCALCSATALQAPGVYFWEAQLNNPDNGDGYLGVATAAHEPTQGLACKGAWSLSISKERTAGFLNSVSRCDSLPRLARSLSLSICL